MKKNPVLIAIIIGAILVSSVIAIGRISNESKSKNVDIVLDYLEFKNMAQQSEHDLVWWFAKFKELGVYGVALNEDSIESLMDEAKPIKVEMVGNVINKVNWKESYPTSAIDFLEQRNIDKFDVLVTTDDEKIYNRIKNGLKSRYELSKFKGFEGENKYIVYLDGNIKDSLYTQGDKLVDSEGKLLTQESVLYSSKLIKLGIGFDEEKISQIKESGLKVVPRPYYYEGWGEEKLLKAVIDDYKNLDINPKYMIFAGSDVLGYKENMEILKEYMNEQDTLVGMIESAVQREHIKQGGLYELTRELDYKTTRIFSVWPYIQKRFKYYNYEGAEEIENTLYRAVTERNVRLIYFKPFKEDDRIYVTEYKAYEDMFDRFKGRIASHKMTLGRVIPMKERHVPVVSKMIMGFGIVAAGILLLTYMFGMNKRIKLILLAIGMLGVVGLMKISSADKLLALSAAIVFPSLSMLYLFNKTSVYLTEDKKSKNILKVIILAIKDLCIACGISFIGSLMVGTLLSDIEYLLEMDIFRGVKFAQLTPILILCIGYLVYFGYKKDKEYKIPRFCIEDVKKIVLDHVKIIHVIIGIAVLGIGYIYIARTGHETNIQPSNIEMIFRNILEEKLFARPRSKEFLIAFPALMVCVLSACRGYKPLIFISSLVAVLGQTSVVNTFCHLRTPMVLSFTRTAYSLLLGIIIGVVYMLLVEVFMWIFRRLRGEKLDA
ncbi:hypothetical protein IZY60_07530 [Lutibacter sp. B2]|nr:hypothetical protein [Lutibacter sp. B2]